MYNCTNHEDVIYKGARPEFEEFGPYYYRESDTYDDVQYSVQTNIPNTTT